MRHGRLSWLAPRDLTVAQREVYDSIVRSPRANGPRATSLSDADGRLHGPFNAMLFSPALGNSLQDLGASIRYRTTMPDRLREIAILEVARHMRSGFEWHAHAVAGRRAGLTDRDIDGIRHGVPGDGLSTAERLGIDVVGMLMTTGDLADDVFERARQEFGDVILTELLTLVGYYRLLAVQMRVWRTPLPDGVADVFGPDPQRSQP
ncbi:MAG TPA: carboxymuconolactone decarboxylase family protein [Micromonosporaceae bacterium]|jgi:Carboxymuconolactone decarboxylase family.